MEPPQTTSNPASDHPTVIPNAPVAQQSAQHTVPQPSAAAPPVAPLQRLAQANFIRPRAKLRRIDRIVHPGNRRTPTDQSSRYANFCEELFNYLQMQFLLSLGAHATPMDEDSFVRVCQTLLVLRVQQVREHRLGQRAAANRISLTRTFPVPAALYEVLAGIGEIYLEHRGFSYVPNLPPVPSPVPNYYTVDPDLNQRFILFMDVLNKHGLHRSVTFPSQFEGTPYWCLDREVDGSEVTVTGTTGEGTPADGLLRSLIDIADDIDDEVDGFVYVDRVDYHSLRNSYFSMN